MPARCGGPKGWNSTRDLEADPRIVAASRVGRTSHIDPLVFLTGSQVGAERFGTAHPAEATAIRVACHNVTAREEAKQWKT